MRLHLDKGKYLQFDEIAFDEDKEINIILLSRIRTVSLEVLLILLILEI